MEPHAPIIVPISQVVEASPAHTLYNPLLSPRLSEAVSEFH